MPGSGHLRRRCRVICVALALVQTAVAAPGPWRHDRDALLVKVDEFRLHTARQGAAAVSWGEHIYVFGGSNWDGSAANVERIDPAARRSERLKPELFSRAFHAALPYDGRIYLFGGQATSPEFQAESTPRYPGQPTGAAFDPVMITQIRALASARLETRIEVFDPATGTVSVLGSMPVARAGMAAAVLGHAAHFVGGTTMGPAGITQTGRHDVFDFVTREWSTALEMMNPRTAPAVTVDRLLVVAGGRVGDRGLRAVEIFDPDQRAWKFLPPLEHAAAGHALVRFDHHLFLFGGYDTPKRIMAYDLAARTSSVFRAGLSPVSHATAIVHAGRIYVIGGKPNSVDNETDLVQVFAPNPALMPD